MKEIGIIKKLKKLSRLIKGCVTIGRIIKKNNNFKVFYVYGKGIGDVCIETAYLQPFMKSNKIHGKVIVRENLVNIAKQMQVEDVMSIDDYTATCIEESMHNIHTKSFYYNLLRKEKIFILDPWFYADNYIRRIAGISATKVVKNVALNIHDDNYKKICPVVTYNENTIEGSFVIINPYSNSMNLDLNVWNDSINFLKNKGYSVYTNVTKTQKELPGTKRLEVTIEALYNLASKAELIISIRSGIIDYIISNSKNMIVVYEGYNFRDFYSLDEWEDEINLKQIVDNGEIDVAKQIIDSIIKLGVCKNND